MTTMKPKSVVTVYCTLVISVVASIHIRPFSAIYGVYNRNYS